MLPRRGHPSYQIPFPFGSSLDISYNTRLGHKLCRSIRYAVYTCHFALDYAPRAETAEPCRVDA